MKHVDVTMFIDELEGTAYRQPRQRCLLIISHLQSVSDRHCIQSYIGEKQRDTYIKKRGV